MLTIGGHRKSRGRSYAEFRLMHSLVDCNNLGDQTLREFQNYAPPDHRLRFSELYTVDKLTGAGMVDSSHAVISTVQGLHRIGRRGSHRRKARRDLAPSR